MSDSANKEIVPTPKVFLEYGPSVESGDEIKCPYITCAFGMGLAGMYRCSAGGTPKSEVCDKWEKDPMFED